MPRGVHGGQFFFFFFFFRAVVSRDGWMFALTRNADIKHEPAALWGLVQSKNKMNAQATARKTAQAHNLWDTFGMCNRAVA